MTQAPASGADDRRMTDDEIIESIGGYEYGWHDSDDYSKDVPTGINEEIVRFISEVKDEPQWMRERRLKALELFERKPMPAWGPDLSHVDFDSFKYYVRPTDRQVNDWEDLPEEIRDTYDRLGIPEAEKSRLVSGVAAQYESEVVYQQIQETWSVRELSSLTPTPACASTRRFSRSTSVSACPRVTTSSPRSTPPHGPVVPSCTSPRGST